MLAGTPARPIVRWRVLGCDVVSSASRQCRCWHHHRSPRRRPAPCRPGRDPLAPALRRLRRGHHRGHRRGRGCVNVTGGVRLPRRRPPPPPLPPPPRAPPPPSSPPTPVASRSRSAAAPTSPARSTSYSAARAGSRRPGRRQGGADASRGRSCGWRVRVRECGGRGRGRGRRHLYNSILPTPSLQQRSSAMLWHR